MENKLQIDAETHFYSVEYHRINQKPSVIRFNIAHKREEGAEKLALLIYQEIDKRLKKNDTKKKE